MGVRHPINYDLAMINQAEQLQSCFKPMADLRLKAEDISRANTVVSINAMSLQDVRMAFPIHARQIDQLHSGVHLDINMANTTPNNYSQPYYSGPKRVPSGSQDPNALKKFPSVRTPPGRPPAPTLRRCTDLNSMDLCHVHIIL